MYRHFWELLACFKIGLNFYITYGPEIPFLPKNTNTRIFIVCVFITTVFIIAPNQKQTKCHSTEEWSKNIYMLLYILCTNIYLLHIITIYNIYYMYSYIVQYCFATIKVHNIDECQKHWIGWKNIYFIWIQEQVKLFYGDLSQKAVSYDGTLTERAREKFLRW